MAREFAKAFYNSKEWQNTRKYILMRDKYLCVKCGAPAEEVHHKKHLSPSNITDTEITMNPENLVSLCRECHFAEHKADKIKGIKSCTGATSHKEGYIFDANGYLIKV